MDSISVAEQSLTIRWITWLTLLGVITGSLALLGVVIPGPLCRIGLLDYDHAIRIIRLGAYCGVLATAISLAALLAALLHRQPRYMTGIGAGLVLGILSAGIPSAWLSKLGSLPAIHDISTDTTNPPEFQPDVLAARKSAANSAIYAGASTAIQQARAYPDIQTMVFERSWTIIYPAALRTVENLGWKLDSNDPMRGVIEATTTSHWFGISYDLAIRIRGSGDTTRLDIRSESRQGLSDAGNDAHLIRVFRDALYKQLGTQRTERH